VKYRLPHPAPPHSMGLQPRMKKLKNKKKKNAFL
jgi:hypothetical protein